MMSVDYTFDGQGWQEELEALEPDTQLSALRFLTLLEGEQEEAFEEALQLLQSKHILLDIQDLPKPVYASEMAVRLRREEQLVQEGKLLSALEENDPLKLYLQELAAMPAQGDPALLAERLLKGDQSAASQLTNLMLSRVIDQAFALVGKGVLLLDLIQEGSLGLWQGLLSYTGGDVEAHCDWHIRWDLARAITTHAREAGVGQRMKQAVEDYRAVDQELLGQLGRNPTLQEIADALHMTAEEAAQVARTVDAAQIVAKAKQPEPEQEDPEEALAVEDTAYFQTRQRIAELLSTLTAEEAKLLTLRFGLEGGRPMSPEDTGKQLGLTPEEVVAQEAAALLKLRNA